MRKIPSSTISLLIACLGISSFSRSEAAPAPAGYSLNDLYRTGLGKNELVNFQQESLVQAQEQRKRATGLLLPTIDVLGTYFRQDEVETTLGRSVSPSTQRTWKLTAKQPIFQGGSEYAALSQTKRTVEAAEQGVSASEADFYLEISGLYFDYLLTERQLEQARTEYKLYSEQVQELKNRVKIGRSRTSDLLTVEAAWAAAESSVKTLEAGLLAAGARLQSLGRVEGTLAVREDVPYQSQPLAAMGDYLKWAQEAPAVKAALLRRDASEKAIGVARGQHFPNLDVSGNYYLHREGLNRETEWDMIATLTVPIFAGGTIQSQVRESASRYRQAEVEAGRILRITQDGVRALYQILAAAPTELKALEKARDVAQESYRRVEKDFRFGLADNLDLIQAMKTWQDAQNNFDRTRLTRLRERVQLEVAAGRLPTGA